MGYRDWFEEHAQKHNKIVQKLVAQNYSKEQIIEYFDFENMKVAEQAFCPLYAKNKKCHDIESLNCYLCACPNFRFNDAGFTELEGKTQFSRCAIESKDGEQGIYGDAIHQNCTNCSVPHHTSYVAKHFDLEWKKCMSECDCGD